MHAPVKSDSRDGVQKGNYYSDEVISHLDVAVMSSRPRDQLAIVRCVALEWLVQRVGD